MNGSQTSTYHRLSSRLPKCPRPQAGTEPCSAQRNRVFDVTGPEMAKQSVEVPETVSQDRIQRWTLEQTVDILVPQVLEELAEVSKASSLDRVQHSSVEQTAETPDTTLAEMIVEVPVIQTSQRSQQVVNTSVQHVFNTVEVEKPKLVKETGQKPIIQEKINQVTKPTGAVLEQGC